MSALDVAVIISNLAWPALIATGRLATRPAAPKVTVRLVPERDLAGWPESPQPAGAGEGASAGPSFPASPRPVTQAKPGVIYDPALEDQPRAQGGRFMARDRAAKLLAAQGNSSTGGLA